MTWVEWGVVSVAMAVALGTIVMCWLILRGLLDLPDAEGVSDGGGAMPKISSAEGHPGNQTPPKDAVFDNTVCEPRPVWRESVDVPPASAVFDRTVTIPWSVWRQGKAHLRGC